MNSMLRSILPIAVAYAALAQAQPVLTSDDVPSNPGTTIYYRTSTSLVPVDLGEDGANQTWDFQLVPAAAGLIVNWVEPGDTPFASQFPTANRAAEIPLGSFTSYSFNELTSTGFTPLGNGLTAQDTIYSVTVYTRTEPTFIFPASYGMEWTSVYEFESSPGYTVVDSSISEIDAWGTLTDASGTYSCLRYRQHFFVTTYLSNSPISSYTVWVYSWGVPERGTQVSITSSPDDPPNFTMGYFTRVDQILAVQPGPNLQIIPAQMELGPAFPNPFNHQTRLTFILPQAGLASLTIYDAAGRTIAELARGYFTPGAYQISWEGTGLASGNYYARLVWGKSEATQRLTLVK